MRATPKSLVETHGLNGVGDVQPFLLFIRSVRLTVPGAIGILPKFFPHSKRFGKYEVTGLDRLSSSHFVFRAA